MRRVLLVPAVASRTLTTTSLRPLAVDSTTQIIEYRRVGGTRWRSTNPACPVVWRETPHAGVLVVRNRTEEPIDIVEGNTVFMDNYRVITPGTQHLEDVPPDTRLPEHKERLRIIREELEQRPLPIFAMYFEALVSGEPRDYTVFFRIKDIRLGIDNGDGGCIDCVSIEDYDPEMFLANRSPVRPTAARSGTRRRPSSRTRRP